MKKLLLNFADALLSREQMRRVKGGYGSCPPDQAMYQCVVNFYDDDGNSAGGTNGLTCAPNAYEAEVRNRSAALHQGFGNATWADCCDPIY